MAWPFFLLQYGTIKGRSGAINPLTQHNIPSGTQKAVFCSISASKTETHCMISLPAVSCFCGFDVEGFKTANKAPGDAKTHCKVSCSVVPARCFPLFWSKSLKRAAGFILDLPSYISTQSHREKSAVKQAQVANLSTSRSLCTHEEERSGGSSSSEMPVNFSSVDPACPFEEPL